MLTQIQIHPDPSSSQKDKGDFFERLLRHVMETQRYQVSEQVNFTGTEIDLLCKHLDRPNDTALVECKARTSIVSGDVKNFVFDVIVSERAEYGYFVHTSELHHQVAGMVEELKAKHPKKLIFWGPEKVITLLQHCNVVTPPPDLSNISNVVPSKRILLYSYKGYFWLTILSDKIVPTHYHVARAVDPQGIIDPSTLKWLSNLDELQGLERIGNIKLPTIVKSTLAFETVAEVQEAEEWDDYRPVGAKFFVGRADVRNKL